MSIPNLIPHKTLYISGYIYSYYAFVFIFEFPEHISKHILQSYPYDRGGQTVIVNQSEEKRSNGLGTAGFVLALLGLIFSWMPGWGWVLWLLGLIISFVGIFRVPRGLAIAGLVMSCIALIILIVVAGAIGTLIAAM